MRVLKYTILILVVVSCKRKEPERLYSLWFSGEIGGTDFLIEGNEDDRKNFSVKGSPYFYSITEYDDPLGLGGDDSTQCIFTCQIVDENYNYLSIRYRSTLPDYQFEVDSSRQSFKSFNDFQNLFEIGDVEYVWNGGYYLDDGIVINYQNSQETYSSGINDPNHSEFANCNFKIIDVERFYSRVYKKDGLRVFANFDATVYNGQGDSIRIENADCALLFVP